MLELHICNILGKFKYMAPIIKIMAKFEEKEMIDIQKKMIRMLKNKRKFGGAHTETIHLKNCVPNHLRGKKLLIKR